MIKQKFYSELLNEYYDTEKEALKAEKEHNKKLELIRKEQLEKEKQEEEAKNLRILKAKEVEEAIKLAEEYRLKANKLMKEFIETYGVFHTSIRRTNIFDSIFDNFLDTFFRF